MSKSKRKIQIVEVGPRDGLQNEKEIISVQNRIELIEKLIATGAERIEGGAFVSEKWIPQMKGSADVLSGLATRNPQIFQKKQISVLVPNEQGFHVVEKGPTKEIAFFASASESFSQKNLNCSIDESLKRFEDFLPAAKQQNYHIRGYLSVCFGCPFEGKVSEEKVVDLAHRLIQMGCFEVSIGDTIGIGHVGQVRSLFEKMQKVIPVTQIAGHFHDTRGQALANVLAAFEMGIDVFDSSLGGLGGCPYAPGSLGNVATEDLVYMFHGLGIDTGYSLEKLIETNRWMREILGRPLPSRVSQAAISISKSVSKN
ncbi:MAG: hydroxymethylglutaryl-CoA lyase [Pseudobdellovibrionaceae bacterium]|jgi:hydroxymethylglutaryl-CoA lyase